ncbi:M48 family metalloprotease [Cellulomonas fengjieae]|uniref:M48 family metalloprotease n=1 Tax=Cellulomonas fengjieae TaxID=2819978 RepID=A0ABS3SJV2_9CELL|nr:M48 family metalloprotease [Cellulomonas fengjieae]MBO3086023.1 M48 family metalloprotease [Cellulomonas fengjieae]QVI65908.1 M48 family metalloprotease [Cellulomonas fengjieae]
MTDWGPLAYHHDVATVLERENPVAFGSLRPMGPTTELNQLLLRQTYRVDALAHAEVHAAVQRAADALGVVAPVEIYVDEGGQRANAELVFVPDRVVLILSGATLNLLDADELCAVAGHELAHHVLWTAQDGRFLAASRLLDAAESDARTPSEYLETARRFRLATELYADRGGMLACGSLTTTVSGLVKLATGLAKVDSAAYLRQAAEVDYSVPSAGSTHPETVLRAWALQEWAERGRGADPLVAAALGPQLDLAVLDVLGQDRLAEVTRALVWMLVDEGTEGTEDTVRSDEALDLAGRFGVVVGQAPVVTDLPTTLGTETRRYLAAVLLDFATADDEGGADDLGAVLALARRVGLGDELLQMIRDELDLGDRAMTRVLAAADSPRTVR